MCCVVLRHSVVSDSLQPHGLQPARLLCPWNSPGKNIGLGNYSLLQGIFLTQGSKPGLLHCKHILYHLSHQGSSEPPLKQTPNLTASPVRLKLKLQYFGHLIGKGSDAGRDWGQEEKRTTEDEMAGWYH